MLQLNPFDIMGLVTCNISYYLELLRAFFNRRSCWILDSTMNYIKPLMYNIRVFLSLCSAEAWLVTEVCSAVTHVELDLCIVLSWVCSTWDSVSLSFFLEIVLSLVWCNWIPNWCDNFFSYLTLVLVYLCWPPINSPQILVWEVSLVIIVYAHGCPLSSYTNVGEIFKSF